VSLARSPEDITISQAIEPLEEKKGLVRCLREEYCPRSSECAASGFWRKIQEKLFEILDRTTLKDLIEMKKEKCAKSSGYPLESSCPWYKGHISGSHSPCLGE